MPVPTPSSCLHSWLPRGNNFKKSRRIICNHGWKFRKISLKNCPNFVCRRQWHKQVVEHSISAIYRKISVNFFRKNIFLPIYRRFYRNFGQVKPVKSSKMWNFGAAAGFQPQTQTSKTNTAFTSTGLIFHLLNNKHRINI